MAGFIENLRQKSESYRKSVAIGASLFLTLAIFGVWMTVLFPGIVSNHMIFAQDQNQNQQANVSGVLGAGLSDDKTAQSSNGETKPSAMNVFNRNLAQSFRSVQIQWGKVFSYFKQTEYEAPSQVEIVPTPGSSAQNAAINKGSSVVY